MKVKSFVRPIVEIKNTRATGDYYIIYPEYLLSGRDLMMKGGKFYAVLDPKTNFWSTDKFDLYRIIDQALYSFADEHYDKSVNQYGDYEYFVQADHKIPVYISTLEKNSTKRLRDLNIWMKDIDENHNYHPLDSDLTFKGEEVEPDQYRSKTLHYAPKEGSIENYDRMMSVLYSPNERQKLEWAIGSVLSGDSKDIEKMVVLFGAPKSGKSTVLDLIARMFEGYTGLFNAADLASRDNQFATALFKDNPLVMIQDDGTLSRIDSPEINMIISHKKTIINEKGKGQYPLIPLAMCFMATNDPVDIRDTNLGISRRLLDVSPTENLLPVTEYRKVYKGMMREMPAIADHCLKVYESLGKEYYISYVPREMIVRTNYIWNFIDENLDFFLQNDPVRRDDLFAMYKNYIELGGIRFSLNKIEFTSKMKEYYKKYLISGDVNGRTYKNVFSGFKLEKMYYDDSQNDGIVKPWLKFDKDVSPFDKSHKDCFAQYEVEDEDGTKRPAKKWDNVDTKLKDLDTSQVHFVKLPPQEIVTDFDFQDKDGNKDFEKNYREALKWPETYAELSKSGGGIHLHYIYEGDVNELKTRLGKYVEIKVFPADKKSALRRRLTKCNNLKIATLVDGDLPKKEKKGDPMLDKEIVRNDEKLHSFLIDCMKKKHHGATMPEVSFMKKVLDEYYSSGTHFDIRDLRADILAFASHSTHQAKKCIEIVNQMYFCSDDVDAIGSSSKEYNDRPIIFFDCEVFPNLFVLNWKYAGEDTKVVRMINPTPQEVTDLVDSGRLIGFNNRKYDNHILYARMNGYSNIALYELSQRIIVKNDMTNLPGLAYNLSYADIYDYMNGDNKMGLKKWEIKLKIHHKELGLPWDQPVAEELWPKVAEYCDNDVIATEAVFNATQPDFIAREILADLSGKSVNDTTNTHTQQIIFGNDRNPQPAFVYTDLSKEFPGYLFDNGVSTYRGEVTGEGGYVYAEPGIYHNVALLDIASMHPTSLEQLNMFGRYTKNFSAIKQARIYIKHGEFDKAGELFDGKLKKYLTDKSKAKELSNALKIAINSVYGLTSAKFENRCRDPRNVDNIVAKRGALFMINLKHEVQDLGYTVAHIKTDSIKIPDADDKIIQFVMEYGRKYGYTFEHEATYRKMCLVNDAVYIAQADDGHWTATGAEFQKPFIFKTLFSKEEVTFDDMCETKSVVNGELYLDFNEGLDKGEHTYKFVGKVGSFIPVAPGSGGGELLILRNEKYVSATGAKGWRWMEAEDAKLDIDSIEIDQEYFNKQCSAAEDHINEFGSFESFIND